MNAKTPKYEIPEFLKGVVEQVTYNKWLERKARSLRKRDKKRFDDVETLAEYKERIHKAVYDSSGNDYYIGNRLDWSLIGTYRNEESKLKRGIYKNKFAHLPTVDHLNGWKETIEFVICSWKVNDAKNDLSRKEFLELCKKVVGGYD